MTKTLKLTRKLVAAELRERGIALTGNRDEYRVHIVGHGTTSDYFANDLQDAFDTGLRMATARDERIAELQAQINAAKVSDERASESYTFKPYDVLQIKRDDARGWLDFSTLRNESDAARASTLIRAGEWDGLNNVEFRITRRGDVVLTRAALMKVPEAVARTVRATVDVTAFTPSAQTFRCRSCGHHVAASKESIMMTRVEEGDFTSSDAEIVNGFSFCIACALGGDLAALEAQHHAPDCKACADARADAEHDAVWELQHAEDALVDAARDRAHNARIDNPRESAQASFASMAGIPFVERPAECVPPFGPAPLSNSDQRLADEDADTQRIADENVRQETILDELLSAVRHIARRSRSAHLLGATTASKMFALDAARLSRILSAFFSRDVDSARNEWAAMSERSRDILARRATTLVARLEQESR